MPLQSTLYGPRSATESEREPPCSNRLGLPRVGFGHSKQNECAGPLGAGLRAASRKRVACNEAPRLRLQARSAWWTTRGARPSSAPPSSRSCTGRSHVAARVVVCANRRPQPGCLASIPQPRVCHRGGFLRVQILSTHPPRSPKPRVAPAIYIARSVSSAERVKA